jgi:hypothetical protein
MGSLTLTENVGLHNALVSELYISQCGHKKYVALEWRKMDYCYIYNVYHLFI